MLGNPLPPLFLFCTSSPALPHSSSSLSLNTAQLSITHLPENQGWSTGLGSAHGWLPGVGRCILQHPAPVGSLPRVGRATSPPPRGWVWGWGCRGMGPTGAELAAPRCCGELLPSRATRLEFQRHECWGGAPAGPPALPWPPRQGRTAEDALHPPDAAGDGDEGV